jgi:acyl-CoA thioesterase I
MRSASPAPVVIAFVAAILAFLLGEGEIGVAGHAWQPPAGIAGSPLRGVSAILLPKVAGRLGQRRSLKIIAFGSSSTQGIGASSPAHAYPALLEKDLRVMLGTSETVTVQNRGVGGEDADDMLVRLERDVLSEKPDLVIWQTGTNDPLRKVPLDRFVVETLEGVRRMQAAGIEIMLMEPQDCRLMRGTPGSGAYREAVRAIGAEIGVPVIRRYDLMKTWLAGGTLTEAKLMASDGLHMADEGYAQLAAEVARELMEDAGLKAPPVVAVKP